ncbi:endolytic transglycosylase MltG [Myxococcota bacterium]|nr:endolytic transglycosylase MltG [Myxococcota bacterium]
MAPAKTAAEKPGPRMRRMRQGLLVLVALGVAGVAALAGWTRFALSPVAMARPGHAEPAYFEVEAGDGFAAVARKLEARGLIRSALAMRAYARLQAIESALKVGEYELAPGLSTPEIASILASGRVRTHAVVIPEGSRALEIAARLASEGLVEETAFLDVVFDPESPERFEVPGPTLEGYLFPDTYRFAKGLPPDEIARAMVEQFRTVYRALRREAPKTPLSMLELVTLASIVEKETGAPEERPLIAAVFLNRMRLGMRLETDPTVIYGIEDFDGNLRRVHLEDEANPYNTYRIPGLPPGPIASPGREAMRAVLEPADSPFLYFVSRNDGSHVFSKSYRDHARAVVHFQKQRRRR